MKIKKLALIGILAATAISFSFVGKPITVTTVRDMMLMNLFTDYEPADTTITIVVKNYFGNDVDGKLHPANMCGYDASYMAGVFSSAVDTTYEGYTWPVRNRIVSLFGADVIKTSLKTAGKDYEGKPIMITQYSGVGIQAVFNKLYQKPTSTFKGIALQKLYNAGSKQYMREATDIVVGLMAKKTIWDAQVKKYQLQVATDPEFYMEELASETYTKIFGEKEETKCSPPASRMIGSMLRRAGDGSLPTMMLLLKTVLKDYDPEYYNKVALKF